MKRRAWLILCLAAVFGLRAPLCLYACSEASSPAPVASAAAPESGPAPCHGNGSEAPAEPAPDSPVPTDHACDCDSFLVVLSKGESSKAHGSLQLTLPAPTRIAARAPAPEIAPPHLRDGQPGLPSPDILLLKSTLLL